MRIGLITPMERSAWCNPGAHTITMGIRRLVKWAEPDAVFLPLDMLNERPQQWPIAMTCDALLMCGNPRFNLSERGEWWDTGIWNRLLECQLAGVRVIDAWAGACYPHGIDTPIDDMAREIAAVERNRDLLKIAPFLHARIVRDPLMERIYDDAGAQSILLPCSSAWAAEPMERRSSLQQRSAVVLIALENHDWLPQALHTYIVRTGAEPVAVTWDDYAWAKRHGISATLIYDEQSQIDFYRRTERVLSFRIHQTIPAASVGCEVANIAIDSRSLICEQFDIPIIPLEAFREGKDPEFRMATIPSPDKIIETLGRLLRANP